MKILQNKTMAQKMVLPTLIMGVVFPLFLYGPNWLMLTGALLLEMCLVIALIGLSFKRFNHTKTINQKI